MSKRRNYIILSLYKPYGESEVRWVPSYYTRKGFVVRLATDYYYGGNIVKNIVDDMEVARQERVSRWYCSWRYTTKYYLAKEVSGGYIKVDINDYIDEILEIEEVIRKRKLKSTAEWEHRKRLMNNYEFRRDPVPGVHNYNNHHRGDWYRHPKTTGTKRKEFYRDEEYIFKDTKIKYLPSVYDDIVRHKDKSWKTSCKIKKQWMKHLDNHIDTM